MEYKKVDYDLNELLVKIALDQELIKFPIGEIEEYFTEFVISQKEFETIWLSCLKFLKNKFSHITAHTFVVVSSKYFNSNESFQDLDTSIYIERLECLYEDLSRVLICPIPKESSDGEIIKELKLR